jgi:hypothetical protein
VVTTEAPIPPKRVRTQLKSPEADAILLGSRPIKVRVVMGTKNIAKASPWIVWGISRKRRSAKGEKKVRMYMQDAKMRKLKVMR